MSAVKCKALVAKDTAKDDPTRSIYFVGVKTDNRGWKGEGDTLEDAVARLGEAILTNPSGRVQQ